VSAPATALGGRPRLLVVRTDSPAGLICTLPLLRALREGHASAWIGVLTTAALAPLLARHPHVSEVLAWPGSRSVVAPVRTLLALRARRLDDVILADAAPAGRVAAAMRRIGAQRVIAREAIPGDTSRLHESDRVLSLGAALALQPRARSATLVPDSGELMHFRAALAARSRDLQRPIVAVHIGQAGDAERWPADRFAALMRRRHERDGTGFVLLWRPGGATGGPPEGDDAVAHEIHTRLVGVPCLRWPVATLSALVAALADCDSVIAPGRDVPMLAAALGKPVAALWGHDDAQRWRPFNVPYELARAPGGALAAVTVDQALAACEVLATRVSLLAEAG
jgi:ADP-heptose:LPS heptosyltransferase